MASLNLVNIAINDHNPIFADFIELLADALDQLGHGVTISTNRFISDRINLLVGQTAFLFPNNYVEIRSKAIPYIVFQVEVLDNVTGFAPQRPAYIEFLAGARQIWDYSPANLPFLAERGYKNIHHIPLGYSHKLDRIAAQAQCDIDVLFYGTMNARRHHVVAALEAQGLRLVSLFGVHGRARDEVIARAKIVLNIHQFDAVHLEEIRLSYLLNNRRFIISETSDRDPYSGGVEFAEYKNLPECCHSFLRPEMDLARARIAAAGYTALKEIPMLESIRSALKAIE